MPIVYKGRVFSVEVARVRYPDGAEHEVAVVRHAPSVVLLPVQDDGRIILVRQYRPALRRELWELPAGSIDAGETVEQAAARECEEEVGLVPGRIEPLRGLYPTPGFCDEELIFVRVSDFSVPDPRSRRAPDEDETIHVETFTVDDAKALATRGVIVDLKTVYGLTLL
jgi:ADP-ribose pyrophosphatase